MPASVLETVLTTLKTQLAVPNGSSPYTNDLSGDGVVQIGEPLAHAAGAVPRVWIWPAPFKSAYSAEMGSYDEQAPVLVHARVAATGSDSESRVLASVRLLQDLVLALRADRDLGGTVLDAHLEGSTWTGQSIGFPGVVGCDLVIRPWWIATDGQGV